MPTLVYRVLPSFRPCVKDIYIENINCNEKKKELNRHHRWPRNEIHFEE